MTSPRLPFFQSFTHDLKLPPEILPRQNILFQLEGTIVELTSTIERLKKESEKLNDHARVKLRKNHR